MFMWLLDILEDGFMRLAGVKQGKVYQAQGKGVVDQSTGEVKSWDDVPASGDLITLMVGNDNVRSAFNAFIVVAVALIMFFTVLQIIREQYKNKDGGNPYIIVFRMFKGIITMLFITAAVLAGLQISGVVLTALRGASNGGSPSNTGGMIFRAMAYDANRVRIGGGQLDDLAKHLVDEFGNIGGVTPTELANAQAKSRAPADKGSGSSTGGTPSQPGAEANTSFEYDADDAQINRNIEYDAEGNEIERTGIAEYFRYGKQRKTEKTVEEGWFVSYEQVQVTSSGKTWLLPYVDKDGKHYLELDFAFNRQGIENGFYTYQAGGSAPPGSGGNEFANAALTDAFKGDSNHISDVMKATFGFGGKKTSGNARAGSLDYKDAGSKLGGYLMFLMIAAAVDSMFKMAVELTNIAQVSIWGSDGYEPFMGWFAELMNLCYMIDFFEAARFDDEDLSDIEEVPLITKWTMFDNNEAWGTIFSKKMKSLFEIWDPTIEDSINDAKNNNTGEDTAGTTQNIKLTMIGEALKKMGKNAMAILLNGSAPLVEGFLNYICDFVWQLAGRVKTFSVGLPSTAALNRSMAFYNQLMSSGNIMGGTFDYWIGRRDFSGAESMAQRTGYDILPARVAEAVRNGETDAVRAANNAELGTEYSRMADNIYNSTGVLVGEQLVKRVEANDAAVIERALVERGVNMQNDDEVYGALGMVKRTDYNEFLKDDIDSGRIPGHIRDVWTFEGTNSGIMRVADSDKKFNEQMLKILKDEKTRKPLKDLAGCITRRDAAAIDSMFATDEDQAIHLYTIGTFKLPWYVYAGGIAAGSLFGWGIVGGAAVKGAEKIIGYFKGETLNYNGTLQYGNAPFVSLFYDFSEMDFVIAFLCVFIAVGVFINFMFALVQRLLELLILYILSPITLAMYPFDDGAAFKQKFFEPFYKKVISIYAIVLSMNLFFLLLSPITAIRLWDGSGITGMLKNQVMQVFILVALMGLLPAVRGTITAMLGAEKLEEKNMKDVVKGAHDQLNKGGFSMATTGATSVGMAAWGLAKDKASQTDKAKQHRINQLMAGDGKTPGLNAKDAAAAYEAEQRETKGALRYAMGKAAGAVGKGMGKIESGAKKADWAAGKVANAIGGEALFGKGAFGGTRENLDGTKTRHGGLLQGMGSLASQALKENSVLRAMTDLDVGPLAGTGVGKYLNENFTRKGRHDKTKKFRDARDAREALRGDDQGRMEGNLNVTRRDLEKAHSALEAGGGTEDEKNALLGIAKGSSSAQRMAKLALLMDEGKKEDLDKIGGQLKKGGEAKLAESTYKMAQMSGTLGALNGVVNGTGDNAQKAAAMAAIKAIKGGDAKNISDAFSNTNLMDALGADKATAMSKAFGNRDLTALATANGKKLGTDDATKNELHKLSKNLAGVSAIEDFKNGVKSYQNSSSYFTATGQDMTAVRNALVMGSGAMGTLNQELFNDLANGKEIAAGRVPGLDIKLRKAAEYNKDGIVTKEAEYSIGDGPIVDMGDLQKAIRIKMNAPYAEALKGIDSVAVADYDRSIKRNEVFQGSYLHAMGDEIKKSFEWFLSSMSPEGRNAITGNTTFMRLWADKDISGILRGMRCIQQGNIEAAHNPFKDDKDFCLRFQTLQGHSDIGYFNNMLMQMGDVDGMQVGKTPITANNAMSFALWGQFNQALGKAARAQIAQLDSQETTFAQQISTWKTGAASGFKNLLKQGITGFDESRFNEVIKKAPEYMTAADAAFMNSQVEAVNAHLATLDKAQAQLFATTWTEQISSINQYAGAIDGIVNANLKKNPMAEAASKFENTFQETLGKLLNMQAPKH
jgi:hypothetical protein